MKKSLLFFLLFCMILFIPCLSSNVAASTYSQPPSAGGDDGNVYGNDATYITARTTGYSSSDSSQYLCVGQYWSGVSEKYRVDRAFLKFDTTSIPADATLSSAVLKLRGYHDHSDVDFEIYVTTWTGDTAITTADFTQYGLQYGGGISTSNFSTTGYNNYWISAPYLTTVVVRAGQTKICVISYNDFNSIEPDDDEYVEFYSVDSAYDPALEVVYTTNNAPSNGSPSGTNWDDTDKCYSQYKEYQAIVVYTDTDGYDNLDYVELRIKNSGGTTRAIFRYDEDDNLATVQSGSTEWDLNTTASNFVKSGNTITVTWRFKPQWDATAENDCDFELYCIDASSASDTDASDQNFDVITDLTVSSIECTDADNPDRLNVASSTQIDITVVYSGSALYPPDAEFTSIALHDASHSVIATDNSISNGVANCPFTSVASATSTVYHAYINMADADYTDDDEATTETIVTDSLTVYNLQAIEYLTNSQFKYRAQIKYASDSSTISGAYVNVSLPSGSIIGQLTSNSSGWITFILTQTNGSASGTYNIFGITDNVYGITVAGANQTFVLRSWEVASHDTEGNALSSTIFLISKASVTVYTGNATTIRVPETSFNVSITWQSIEVNSTTNIAVSGNTATNFTCNAYPYVYSDFRYWVASNATIDSCSWSDSILTIQFNDATANYVLKASCTTKPRYILNCTYDYDVDWSTILTLMHYANTTITIGYPGWSEYVNSVDSRLTAISWNEQTVTLTFAGTGTGTVEFYVGNRGNPSETSGFTTAIYSSGTKLLTGTFAFASDKTVSMSWETSAIGPGGFTQSQPALMIDTLFLINGTVKPEITVNAVLHVEWEGATVIYLYDILFERNQSWFSVSALPCKLQKSVVTMQGESEIQIPLLVPRGAKPGVYKIPCELIFKTESAQTVSVGGVLEFTVESTAQTIPEYTTILFLIVLGIILMGAMSRTKRK